MGIASLLRSYVIIVIIILIIFIILNTFPVNRRLGVIKDFLSFFVWPVIWHFHFIFSSTSPILDSVIVLGCSHVVVGHGDGDCGWAINWLDISRAIYGVVSRVVVVVTENQMNYAGE